MILLVHTKSYTRKPVTRAENYTGLRNTGGFVTPELKLFFLFKNELKHNLIYIKLIYFSKKF